MLNYLRDRSHAKHDPQAETPTHRACADPARPSDHPFRARADSASTKGCLIMANQFLTTKKVGEVFLDLIHRTAKEYGVDPVDLANAFGGTLFHNSSMRGYDQKVTLDNANPRPYGIS